MVPKDCEAAEKAKVILLYLICILGAPANLLSLFVLTRLQMKFPMKCCLQFLAAFDCVYLILRFLSIHIVSKNLVLKILRHMALSASIWTTVLVSIIIFIAVRYPFMAKTLYTYRRIMFGNFLCLLIAIGLSIPRFFFFTERKSDTNIYLSYFLFLNIRYGSQLRTVNTEAFLSERELFIAKLYGWVQIFMLYIVPAIFVTSFNVCVLRETRKLKRLPGPNACYKQREIDLAGTVLFIVVVFLVTGAPWVVIMIANLCGSLTPITYKTLWLLLGPLPAVNSAANFIIYLFLNRDFRKTLFKMLHVHRNQTGEMQSELDLSLNTTGKASSENIGAVSRM